MEIVLRSTRNPSWQRGNEIPSWCFTTAYCAWLGCKHSSTSLQESWALHSDKCLDHISAQDSSQDLKKQDGCNGKARVFSSTYQLLTCNQRLSVITESKALIQGLTYSIMLLHHVPDLISAVEHQQFYSINCNVLTLSLQTRESYKIMTF